MHKGADLNVPTVFKFILKYVTPVYMLTMLGVWIYQEAIPKFFMKDVESGHHLYLWGARLLILLLILLTLWMVRAAWKRKATETA